MKYEGGDGKQVDGNEIWKVIFSDQDRNYSDYCDILHTHHYSTIDIQ